MKVLVACEFSGVVRRAFRALGHHAWSCDLLAAEDGSEFHLQDDVRNLLTDGWDVMIAHPPCTHLAVSGARWFPKKRQEQLAALAFVRDLLDAPIPRICVENPISIISSKIRKPDQIIQPWQFGHGEVKATCLWLKNLPLLKETDVVDGRLARVHREPPGPDRWKNRSRTYQGIADAMARQWSELPFVARPNGTLSFDAVPALNVEVPDSSDVGKVRALIAHMRSDGPRWQHSYGSLEVIYASVADDWADELEVLLAALLGSGAAPLREKTEDER